MVKTVDSLLQKVTERVKELHSYRIPEIIAFQIQGGSKDYFDWIDRSIDLAPERG